MRRAFQVLGVVFVLLAGAGQAAAESKVDKTIAFQKRVDDAARMLEGHPRMRDMSQDRRHDIVEFVAGNMFFALLHEMGHVHISEMGLPVLGREEDAADSFAVITMLKVGSAFSHDVLVEAAMGWFLSAYRDEKEGAKLAFYDEHGLDKQRAFQIVCLMVGADMEKFRGLATKIGMPPERQESCIGDYSNASWSWATAMKPHLRTPDQPKTQIEVVYGEGKDNLRAFEQTFRAVQLLEMVAYQASNEYVWRRPFTLEMQTCGKSGGFWDLATRKLTLCYEMALEFSDLYRQYPGKLHLPRYSVDASSP